jgi:hypothetical protein
MWVGGKRPVAAEVRKVMWQARQDGQPVSSAAQWGIDEALMTVLGLR